MREFTLTQEGQETLDAVLDLRVPILRPRWKSKILHFLDYAMKAKGETEAGKERVLEAVRFVTEGSLMPSIVKFENIDKFQEMQKWDWDNEEYYTAPRRIKRWESMATKPAKPLEEMKVLALNSSPRAGGNTDVLIDEALRGAKEVGAQVEKIMLSKQTIKHCIHCLMCKKPGYERYCALKDDMSDFIFQKVLDADAAIIGFPIYTGREPVNLALFLERLYCEKRVKGTRLFKPGGKKRAMVISTWGHRSDNIDEYDHVIQKIITLLKVRYIETIEAISAEGLEGRLRGVDDNHKAMILRYPEELEKVYQAGKTLVTGDIAS